MRDTQWSRRRLVRRCVAGGSIALAGCLGDNEPDQEPPAEPKTPAAESPTERPTTRDRRTETPADEELRTMFDLAGDDTETGRKWLVPDNAIEIRGKALLFQHNDFERGAKQGWTAMQDQRENIAGSLGPEPRALEGQLLVGRPGGNTGFIHLGAFDSDAVVEFQQAQGNTVTGQYDRFTVINDAVAVGDDALVETPGYEQHIDAVTGATERLGEADPDVGLLLDLLPAGVQQSVARDPDIEDLVVSGSSVQAVTVGGSYERIRRVLVFADADTASTDRTQEILGVSDESGLQRVEHHGRVVIVEYSP